MVLYMTFGPDMGSGAKLRTFIRLLETGTPRPQAFQQAFGDLKAFEQKLSMYFSKFTMTAAIFPPVKGWMRNTFLQRS